MKFISRQIDKRIAAYQRELIDTHYKEVDNMYRQMRGWRHDYRNHIQMLKALAAKGDMNGINDYLNMLDTDLNTVDLAVKTGNPMADAIINSKISLAKAKGIKVEIDAHIPVKLKMSELDLCCIIGNLFDNAIEASLPLDEKDRLIRVYMDMKNTQLYISFTNFTAVGKQKKIGGALCHNKGRGPRLRPCKGGYDCGTPWRVSEQEQRGRRLYNRNTHPAGVKNAIRHPILTIRPPNAPHMAHLCYHTIKMKRKGCCIRNGSDR